MLPLWASSSLPTFIEETTLTINHTAIKGQYWDWNLSLLMCSLVLFYYTVLVQTAFGSVQLLSCVRLFAIPQTKRARLPCPLPIPGVYSNSCPSSWWCHPTISSSVISSSCLQSFPASESFQMSQFFTSGGQSTGVSASASAIPMNI